MFCGKNSLCRDGEGVVTLFVALFGLTAAAYDGGCGGVLRDPVGE